MNAAHTTRRVLVTGATSGIGRAIAERLLADGHRVVGIGRDLTKVEDLAGERFRALALDLAVLDALPKHLEQLSRDEPALDALVLNAGQGLFGGLEEHAYRQIRAFFDLNLISHTYLARAFLPALKKQRRGDLIFMGSEAALTAGRRGALYSASKFALRGLAQALRQECAKSGVRVSVINPGMVATPFFETLSFTPGEEEDMHLRPEEVAEAVALVLRLRPGAVIDEINLSPLKRVVRGKGGLPPG